MINGLHILPRGLLIFAAVFFTACDRHDSLSPPTPASADESLAVSEYVALGMPSPDREWAGKDLVAAAAQLQALARQSPAQLPRFGSDRSGPVFSRIVARDHLDFFRTRSLPLETRFPDALDYADSLNAILKTYMSALAAYKTLGAEFIELMGAELRAVEAELELVDEFVPTLSKDDPTYPVRMAGLDKMRQGLAGLVVGALTTLTEVQVYDAGTRTKLLGYCQETFPNIVPKLTEPSQQEVLRRLDGLVEDGRVRELRAPLTLLRDEVRAVTKAGG